MPSEPEIVIHSHDDLLLGAQVAFGRLDGGVPQQKLDLFEVAARLPTELRAGPAQVMGAEALDPDLLRRLLNDRPDRPVAQHTFRHTYSSLLAHTGNDVRVVQELMRHAKVSTTMEIYTHAAMDKKRVAQQKAVDHLLSRDKDGTTASIPCSQIVPKNVILFPDHTR